MALLRRWMLDAVDGSGHTADIGGGGFTGTLKPTYPGNVPAVGGGPCQALPGGMVFDGVDDYVDVGLAHTVTNVFAVSAWIRAVDYNRRSIYSAGNTASCPTFGVSNLNGNGGVEVTIPGLYCDLTVDIGLILLGKWHHICYSRGGTTKALRAIYVDGQSRVLDLTASHTNDTVMVANSSATTLGCRAAASQLWNGGLADVRLYDAALTPQEVFDLYQVSRRENAMLLAGAL